MNEYRLELSRNNADPYGGRREFAWKTLGLWANVGNLNGKQPRL